jgi:DNA-binding IclR family transcriptional regulator
MRPSADCVCGVNGAPARFDEQNLQALRARVSAEFREMPGLVLTLAQAARLFSLDASRCERVLDSLVDCGVLVTNGSAFSRADARTRRDSSTRTGIWRTYSSHI